MIDYYLGESPWIAQVPTYRCADPEELEIVLDRLDQLVTKPVDGYGGGGVLIGADADGSEIDARRGAILADPSRWVAQETISLSTLPTLTGGGFESRHVDLRTFVYLTGTEPDDAELAGLALTRVAPRGSMVVNSSRAGRPRRGHSSAPPPRSLPEDRMGQAFGRRDRWPLPTVACRSSTSRLPAPSPWWTRSSGWPSCSTGASTTTRPSVTN
jgi:hypothetical protein